MLAEIRSELALLANLVQQALSRVAGVVSGIALQNQGGGPIAGGPFTTFNLGPGLTATNSGGGVALIIPATVPGGDVAGIFACAPGSVAGGQSVKETVAGTFVALAQADSAADAAIGVCSQVINPSLVLVTFNGEVAAFGGLTPDATYFLDPAVPGGITTVDPTTVGQIVQIIGRAKSATTLVVEVTGDYIQL
jgi:hypothetical protein